MGPIGRALSGLIVIAVGALIGMAIGQATHWPALGTLAGALLPASWYLVRDGLRAARLLNWLRGHADTEAPRNAGLWGEIGYRVERTLRLRDRRSAQQEQRLEQFLSAIEASPNGVLTLDEGDHIEWSNSSAAGHFGIDPQRDRHQRLTNLVRAPAFVAHLQGGNYRDPVVFPDPSGQGSLSVMVRPYGDGMKLVLSQDVTERNRNEAMRRDFVANVSHEIRTPLTVLAGFVETLTTLPLDESERARVIELMAQQTARMQTLVADLLTLAQLEGSPRPATSLWTPVAPMLERVLADAEALSAGRHTLTLALAEHSEIAGTPTELTSAAANLVNNAVRYTPAEGRIAIRWSVRKDGSGEIEVEDTGIGIAREHLPRLAERFYRIDQSRSRDTGGTGLGLSIVKHVVQRHGGELQVRSRPGAGSCFSLVFPPNRVRHTTDTVRQGERATV